MMEKYKVAIYARVSTNKTDDDPNQQDPENQLRQMREYCERQGWPIIKEYIDHASGRNSSRDAFQSLFSDAQDSRFNIVVFWALDRFSREGALPTLQYLDRLDRMNINYKSITEQYIDSTGVFNDIFVSLRATIARLERERHVERINSGLDRARAKGVKLGRKPKVTKGKITQIKQLRADQLSMRQIASKVGVSVGTISKVLNRS